MIEHWDSTAIFYHIYPLGFCDAPQFNYGDAQPVSRLQRIIPWLDWYKELGINAIYLGPVFESIEHGYDTSDYYWVDRRLGTNEDLRHLSELIHERGMRLVLDGVFNHTGRHFWAFHSLVDKGSASEYKDWYAGVEFGKSSPYGDPFYYAAWENHFNLPKLNLKNQAVRNHLLEAVAFWMDEFQIDGLRLDAADCVDIKFWQELRLATKGKDPNFWLMGEIIHGDYRKWVGSDLFDSVTNYEMYKSMWSSLNDLNMFEVAYSLRRQYGAEGIYQGMNLYNFVDNHDVSRAASILRNERHLPLLYLMLLTIPGIPSIYYGSEFCWKGQKSDGDRSLRPTAPHNLPDFSYYLANDTIARLIQQLSLLRKKHKALSSGRYNEYVVANGQLAYGRQSDDEHILILINASDQPYQFDFTIEETGADEKILKNLITGETTGSLHNRVKIMLEACSGRICQVE